MEKILRFESVKYDLSEKGPLTPDATTTVR